MQKAVFIFSLGFLSGYSPCSAQDILTDMREIMPKEIKVEGFRLDRSQDIQIEAVGFRPSRRHGFSLTNAWILDAQTRELIWELKDASFEKRGRHFANFTDEVPLPKGDYEVYYSSFPYAHFGRGDEKRNVVERFLDRMFGEDEEEYEDYDKDWRDFRIVVRGKGQRFRESEIDKLRGSFKKNAFISMTSLRDNEYLQKSFLVERPVDVRVYALGEIRKDGTFDYGWIVNTDTRKKVWKFSYRNSEYAGGGRKNRVVNQTISLPSGHYVAFFVTDDSHSYGLWNGAPPYDPTFWGLTVRPENAVDAKYIKIYDYQQFSQQHVIVQFTRLKDNEFRTRGFTCNRNLNVHIYALGEGRDREMFDYGWIVNARTHRRVWEMTISNTEHAGGGDKNRLYDDNFALKKGSYIVYYVTDGSHSFAEWNTAPPHDQENWGITISAGDSSFSKDDISEYDPGEDSKVLAQIVRVRDYEDERQRFKLDRDTEVRIYAIGEGTNGAMYDYGWIEDDSRKVVWEMTYRQTAGAGGDKKNRLFDDTIFLKKGEYIAYFETDDSHSFNHWNAAPPYDPMHWGITISLAEQR